MRPSRSPKATWRSRHRVSEWLFITLTVSDTPGIREEFKAIVYRPVVPRTNTETVHIIDPEVETTLTSSDGSLSVTFPAGAKGQFFQTAIDALSNDCGSPVPC